GADGRGSRSGCQRDDAAEARHGDRQSPLCGAEADRRAGVRPAEGGAGYPRVPVARSGEGGGRVATDLPDAQSAEDLASRLWRRGMCEGIVGADGGAEAETAQAPRKPAGAMGGCGRILGQTPRNVLSRSSSTSASITSEEIGCKPRKIWRLGATNGKLSTVFSTVASAPIIRTPSGCHTLRSDSSPLNGPAEVNRITYSSNPGTITRISSSPKTTL